MAKILLMLAWLGLDVHGAEQWVTVWTGSAQGPYPAGNAVGQPDLQIVFPGGTANDQTFRLVLKPDLWGARVRLRFSNVMGSHALPLDGVHVGVHASAGRILPGTNCAVRFGGASEAN